MAARWVTVGKCGVDSGLVMLIDPCYIIPESLWSRFLQKFRKSEVDGAVDMNGLATVVQTAYGDGVYPVEARYNKSGQIVEVRINFN